MDGTTPCRGRRAVDPAQSTPKGRFVLRADSIRPYNCGGRAAEGSTYSSTPTISKFFSCTEKTEPLLMGLRFGIKCARWAHVL